MSQKAFIITGASKGLGLAIAQALLKDNHKIFAVARSESDLQKLKDQYPSSIHYLAADLADLSVAPKIVEAAKTAFGKIDGLVTNHGVLHPITKIAESNVEEWRHAYDVNILSAVALTKEAIPELRKSEGRIVAVSSGASINAYAGWGAYGTSKAAMNHFVASLAAEEPSITSIAISPGKIDTGMQQVIREQGQVGMAPTVHASFVKEHADGKLLRPEVPGSVIAKLVENATQDLSGKHLRFNAPELSNYQSPE